MGWRRADEGDAAQDGAGDRSVAQLARAPVSKTGGWGFESLHSCHALVAGGEVAQPTRLLRTRNEMARISPIEFLQQVRTEVSKVTWPTRRETVITTIMVLVMVIAAALFFLAADQVLSFFVSFVLGIGR